MTPVRTLPIRLPPLPGEALDSWLEAIARRMDTELGDVLTHLGLPGRKQLVNLPGEIRPDWMVCLDEQQIAAIAHATDIDTSTITAMTLAHYDHKALRLTVKSRAVMPQVLWGRGRGSRFCPECLKTSNGRWQLSWRLGFAFACTRHHRLLADCCPDCGRILRHQPRPRRSVPQPEICGNPPAQPGKSVSAGCGTDLTLASTMLLPPKHPVLAAQDQIAEILDTAATSFGVYTTAPQPASAVLSDIRALGIRFLSGLPLEVLSQWLPADVIDAHLSNTTTSPHTKQTGERPGFAAPPRALDTALAVTGALNILQRPGIHAAADAMLKILEVVREQLSQISVTSIDNWGRGISPVLQSVHLAALTASLRPSEQLRYRIAVQTPSRPTMTIHDTEHRSRNIPSTFWPAWTTRLTPPGGIYARTLGPVLAAVLLIPDSRISLNQAAQLAGNVTDGIGMSRMLQELNDLPQWPDIATALIRLADHLDANDTPINYKRRRLLDYSQLLPHDHWLSICRRTGTPPGTGRRERIARSQLFHRISGMPAESAPGIQAAIDQSFSGAESNFRADSALFAARQTPELAHALQQEALDFLASHHIHDEPVTWQPPATLTAGLQLPGPDPADIDIGYLHQLIRQRNLPPSHAAQVLGTSIDAVRLVLDAHPAPQLPPAERPASRFRQQARLNLPKERFTQLYLDEHLNFQKMATLTGFSPKLLAVLAREYEIPIRTAPDYTRNTIERDWLVEQYIHRRRTLPDLAREAGISRSAMARWARIHNIPLRPRGGASHHTSLRAPDQAETLPAILRKAFTGRFAWQRLSRFVAAQSYPTIAEAAQNLGVHKVKLQDQIRLLERDLGHPLLERAKRGTPMKLTRFGKRVITAVRKIQAEEMPPQ